MNLADKDGNKKKPEEAGMPGYFPEDIKTLVTFKAINSNETEMAVTEYADFGQMNHFAKAGLEQSLDKAKITLLFIKALSILQHWKFGKAQAIMPQNP